MSKPSEVPSVHAAEEIRSLQRCIDDLVSVLGLSATWTGSEPERLVRTLLDALLSILRADIVCARIRDPEDGNLIESVRLAHPQQAPDAARAVTPLLDAWFACDPQRWPSVARIALAEREIFLVPLGVGLYGDGLILVGSRRPDFPRQAERLLLTVAVNQAAIALQEARLLSEQKRAANELDQRVAQRTRELAASIAHEVNQPLAGIVTNASTCLRMLAGTPPNVDGAKETMRRTLRDADRASEVIARLRRLFASRQIVAETVDINEAAREVILLCSAALQRNRVELRTELAEDLPRLTGDRLQLQQVILNLITNASEAMTAIEDRPRDLLLRTSLDGEDLVCVTVRDSGPGFCAQDVERLFTAFYTTKSCGMGVGLSVSRSIIESHNGRLWAECNAGPGATFTFSIPSTAVRSDALHRLRDARAQTRDQTRI